ncbi:DUF3261 domain-containing protein [Bosea caraganae]|uniref:DUF3261 domain-containing protein n=2 Tax=Bosea caraganae TaxID=2763117 RepID=A0A370L844_9HYPH|nr:DUF3261 domain-containing protein [Bosea caraganae]
MRPWRDWLIGGLFFALAGCASDTNSAGTGEATMLIGPQLPIRAISPAEFAFKGQVTQVLTMRFGEQSINLEAQLVMSKSEVRAILLDSLGRRAVTLAWREGKLESQLASWLPPGIRADAIFADMMILYGQPAALQAALKDSGCALELGRASRLLRCRDKEVLRAEYELKSPKTLNGSLHYANLAWGYDVDVQSAEVLR